MSSAAYSTWHLLITFDDDVDGVKEEKESSLLVPPLLLTHFPLAPKLPSAPGQSWRIF